MATEDWMVKAKLVGDFYIIDEQRSVATSSCIEGLRQLQISPVFDKEEKYTGFHELEAAISVENSNETPAVSREIFDRAKQLCEGVVALIAFGTGRSVRVAGDISVKRRISDAPPNSTVPHYDEF